MASAMHDTQTRLPWGVDTEYGPLTDVLLCRPEHYRWLPTSPISQATLDDGAVFDHPRALRQHAEMVGCYEQEGIRCHFLEPDPALPYQVFARDSSAATPAGGVLLALNQWWRRGEYAAVLEFHRASGIPLAGMITAAAVEGGDVMIVEPGCVLIGCADVRTQEPGARQLAGMFAQMGWEARIQAFPSRFVHIDVIVAVLAEKLVAVTTERHRIDPERERVGLGHVDQLEALAAQPGDQAGRHHLGRDRRELLGEDRDDHVDVHEA